MASIMASQWTGVSAIGWPSEPGYSMSRGATAVWFIGSPSGTGWAVRGGMRHDGSVAGGQGLPHSDAPRHRACPDSLPIRGRAILSELWPTDAIERMDGAAQVPAEQHVIVRGGHPATVQGEGQPQQIAEASSGCVT